MLHRTHTCFSAAVVLIACAAAPGAVLAAPEPEEKPALSRVVLEDGQKLRGRVVAQTDESITLELASGARVELPRSGIREITEERGVLVRSSGEIWFSDANRTRYLYSPSAMMLRKGEGYFSQKELLFSSVAYGVTDNISVMAGAVVPYWFYNSGGVSGFNVLAAVKVGMPVTPLVHLAVGAQVLAFPFAATSGAAGVGALFATATVGNENAHLSVSGGSFFSFYPGSRFDPSDLLFTVSGNYRVHANFALVTENWVLPSLANIVPQGELPMFNAFGGRLLGERWAVDLALIRIPWSGMIPIPWVDFTYNFG